MDIRIYYEDTDCGGVVYYANYLRYFERARTELLEARGIFVKECVPKGFFFVVAHQDIDYKSPAFYADVLNIETRISKISSASLILIISSGIKLLLKLLPRPEPSWSA